MPKRTYSSLRTSVDAVNELFIKNLYVKGVTGKKKRKRKIKLPEMPKPETNISLDESSSLQVNRVLDNTFDRLLFEDNKKVKQKPTALEDTVDVSLVIEKRTKFIRPEYSSLNLSCSCDKNCTNDHKINSNLTMISSTPYLTRKNSLISNVSCSPIIDNAITDILHETYRDIEDWNFRPKGFVPAESQRRVSRVRSSSRQGIRRSPRFASSPCNSKSRDPNFRTLSVSLSDFEKFAVDTFHNVSAEFDPSADLFISQEKSQEDNSQGPGKRRRKKSETQKKSGPTSRSGKDVGVTINGIQNKRSEIDSRSAKISRTDFNLPGTSSLNNNSFKASSVSLKDYESNDFNNLEENNSVSINNNIVKPSKQTPCFKRRNLRSYSTHNYSSEPSSPVSLKRCSSVPPEEPGEENIRKTTELRRSARIKKAASGYNEYVTDFSGLRFDDSLPEQVIDEVKRYKKKKSRSICNTPTICDTSLNILKCSTPAISGKASINNKNINSLNISECSAPATSRKILRRGRKRKKNAKSKRFSQSKQRKKTPDTSVNNSIVESEANNEEPNYVNLRRRFVRILSVSSSTSVPSLNLQIDDSNSSYNFGTYNNENCQREVESPTKNVDTISCDVSLERPAPIESTLEKSQVEDDVYITDTRDPLIDLTLDDEDYVLKRFLKDSDEMNCHKGVTIRKKPVPFNGGFNMNSLSSIIAFTPDNKITVKSGKSWRRSLSRIQRNTIVTENLANNITGITRLTRQLCRNSMMVQLSLKDEVQSDLQFFIKRRNEGYAQNKSTFADDFDNLSINVNESPPTAEELVLRRCQEGRQIRFSECFPDSLLQNCHKIGEGVYGEIFMYRNARREPAVLKIIPVEGVKLVNGEKQKKFEEILTEIIITTELSNLNKQELYSTEGFNRVDCVRCVRGEYPLRLLDLWDLYDDDRGSENDSPKIFDDDQLYIIFELANGGKDLEAFNFKNSEQAHSIFLQVASSLAVAEAVLQFEHRDLHWGNVLISKVDEKDVFTFKLNGIVYKIPTCGARASIIDYTLSRITYDNVCLYNDLSQDHDLFTAEGDYQFQIYRRMKSLNKNNWQLFEPQTNILWLHYILIKMIKDLRYKNTFSRTHTEFIGKLKSFEEEILQYKSCMEFISKLYC